MDKEEDSWSNRRTNVLFVIMPEDHFKGVWDLIITVLILFVCITAPWRLAFTEEDDLKWTVIGLVVDTFFLVDLVLNFFTAHHDEEYNLIDDRKVLESYIQPFRKLQKTTLEDGSLLTSLQSFLCLSFSKQVTTIPLRG